MKKLVLSLTILFLSACGIDNNRPATPKEFYYQLNGDWKGSCSLINGFYRIQNIKFEGYYVTFREDVYSDSTCSFILMNYELKANYALGANRDVLIAGSIEFLTRVNSVTATVLDPTTVASYNANNTCGYSDWSFNSPKDINGRTCEVGDKEQATVGTQYMNLIGINPETTLHIGNDRCTLDDSCVTYMGYRYPREYYPWTLTKQP